MKPDHIAITVNNLDESIPFYRDVLGFQVGKQFERKEWKGKACFLHKSNFAIELWEFEGGKENDLGDIKMKGLRHLAFEVEDMDDAVKELRAKGVDVREPQEGKTVKKFTFFEDPDGVVLELVERG
jgi:glyoxylase I family protein